MNIGSTNPGVAGRLSNFTPREFVFDEVQCFSMEALLQSFKFEDPARQKEICTFKSFLAKKLGTERNKAWQGAQTLWWDGIAYKRKSAEYQVLLNRAYDALAQNSEFSRDVVATGKANLVHTIGQSNMKVTVLTEQEFCGRLMKIRERLSVK